MNCTNPHTKFSIIKSKVKIYLSKPKIIVTICENYYPNFLLGKRFQYNGND